jgi:FkbM family methyltransferase
LVIDVGANRGQFSLDVCTAVPSARVLAFEPLAGEAACYRKVFGGLERFELREVALGAVSGRRIIHIARDADSSSLLEFTDLQSYYFPRTAEVGTAAVDVTTLDDELSGRRLPPRTLLKADVQGFELEVLKGATRTLPSLDWIYLEVSFRELYRGQPQAVEIFEYLRACGFAPAELVHPPSAPSRPCIQVDVLFEQRKST